jgi:hypothetical protein
MLADEITLGESATAWAQKMGLTRDDLAAARISGSELGGNEYLRIQGSLPDGRSVDMKCPHNLATHIVSFRIIS